MVPPKYWERLPDESPRYYSAFKAYLEAGEKRTLKDVVEATGYSIGRIHGLSQKFKWRDRVNAFEDYANKHVVKSQLKERVKMAERHARLAVQFQRKLVKRLKTLKVNELKAQDLVKWLEVSVKIERMARGEATEINENKNQNDNFNNNPFGINPEHLTDEELEEIEQITRAVRDRLAGPRANKEGEGEEAPEELHQASLADS